MTAQELRRGRPQQLAADGLLLLVTAIWGSTFVMVKDAVTWYPVFPFLALRFALGTGALLLIGGRRLRSLNRPNILAGTSAGLFLFGGYGLQTLGLQYTTASRAGFITGLSVVLVPMLSALIVRERPERAALIGIGLATIGLALLTSLHTQGLNRGDLLVLLGAVCFAGHIVTIAASSARADPIALTILQLAVVAVLSAAISQGLGQWSVPSPGVTRAAAFTGILATAVAFALQTGMQRYTTATHTALIFTAEPVFAAIFGILLDGDPVTPHLIAGGALILAGAVMSEVDWSIHTAAVVSRYLAPHYVLAACFVLVGLHDPGGWRPGIQWVLTVGLPAFLMLLGVFALALRNGTISDWHVSERKERLEPLLVISSLIVGGLPALLLYIFRGPRFLLGAAVSAYALILVNLLITTFWKISQHASAVALGTTLLTVSFGAAAAPSLLLIPLVAWARVKIGAHTPAQVIAGAVTGVSVTLATLSVLGLVSCPVIR